MRQFINIGDIKALEVHTGSRPPAFKVVLFHGYGANAFNLLPLSRYLNIDQSIHWIFPEGPESIPIEPFGLGKAWFPIDREAIELQKDLSSIHPPGLDSILEKAYQALKLLHTQNSHLIIGGFSQGAMLTTNLIMKTNLKVDGLIVLSGVVLDRQNWKPDKLDITRQGLPFFQSHGKADAILNYLAGKQLETALKEYGLKGKLFSFEGGHEIPEVVLIQLKIFLNQLSLDLTSK